jgi:nicotinamidase-related amidase
VTLEIDPKTTALVSIDLQQATVGRELSPYSASAVVLRNAEIASALREAGGLVIFVRVLVGEIVQRPTDRSFPRPQGPLPANLSEIVPEAGMTEGDILVSKRSWGAFYGTDLDLHLRRTGVKTIIMTGIATNMGVESTARAAHDAGYALVFAEDAMSSMGDMHRFAVDAIFPMMGLVRSTSDIVSAITQQSAMQKL